MRCIIKLCVVTIKPFVLETNWGCLSIASDFPEVPSIELDNKSGESIEAGLSRINNKCIRYGIQFSTPKLLDIIRNGDSIVIYYGIKSPLDDIINKERVIGHDAWQLNAVDLRFILQTIREYH